MTGLFITFEGGDASGKSTQSRLLSEWLNDRGIQPVFTREPGGTELGVEIRRLLLHSGHVSPRAEALLYAADRAHHVETVVQPALDRGEVVIQDRYIDSSIAYQGAGRVLDAHEIANLSAWASNGLLPKLTVLLDLDPATAKQRLTTLGEGFDRLESEKLDFHTRVRDGFLSLAANDPERFLVLDASQPIEVLATAIRARVESLLAR
ncbi:dTMP kinase [Lysinibacter cavernae]|uniref:Thymidylate kinase n=1 Tax=Lysinibacter cavernae TaxID=1640652 RepID=A0A7X5TV39_9MICO|nr:dTMP kinase [Lysinibacter cavernae]